MFSVDLYDFDFYARKNKITLKYVFRKLWDKF